MVIAMGKESKNLQVPCVKSEQINASARSILSLNLDKLLPMLPRCPMDSSS
jgi:hypothetical protein